MLLTFWVIKRSIGLRASRKEELQGLDIPEHGMEAYPAPEPAPAAAPAVGGVPESLIIKRMKIKTILQASPAGTGGCFFRDRNMYILTERRIKQFLADFLVHQDWKVQINWGDNHRIDIEPDAALKNGLLRSSHVNPESMPVTLSL
jgi:hypothetical protein